MLTYQVLSLALHSPIFSSRPIESLCPLRSGSSHLRQVLCRRLGHREASRAVTLLSKRRLSIPTRMAAKSVPRGKYMSLEFMALKSAKGRNLAQECSGCD